MGVLMNTARRPITSWQVDAKEDPEEEEDDEEEEQQEEQHRLQEEEEEPEAEPTPVVSITVTLSPAASVVISVSSSSAAVGGGVCCSISLLLHSLPSAWNQNTICSLNSVTTHDLSSKKSYYCHSRKLKTNSETKV